MSPRAPFGPPLLDAALLLAVLAVASDALVRLGPAQSALWLACYALAGLRMLMCSGAMAALWPRQSAVLAYPAVCLLSVAWSVDPGESLRAAARLWATVLIGGWLGWRHAPGALLRALALVLGLSLALSLLHGATGLFGWEAHPRGGGLAGLYSHKNMLGQRALLATLAGLALWLSGRRGAGLALLALALPALVAARSMTAILLAPPLAAALLWLCRDRLAPVWTPLAFGAALVALALVPLGVAVSGATPLAWLFEATGRDATLTGRTHLWAIAGDAIARAPLLGHGHAAFWSAPEFETARRAAHAAGAVTRASFHGFVPEIRVGTGWPGLAAMALLLGTALRRLWRCRATPMTACALLLVAGGALAALVGPALWRGHELALLLTVAWAVSAGETAPAKRGHGGTRPMRVARRATSGA